MELLDTNIVYYKVFKNIVVSPSLAWALFYSIT